MKSRRIVLVVVALLVAAFAVWFLSRRPRGVADWAVDHAIPAAPMVIGHELRITNVRNFRFPPGAEPVPRYYDATYDLDSLQSVWFVLTAFSQSSRIPAHTFVSFGFAGDRYLSVSIEARRERGESYGILAGALRRFELIYVFGDERDLIGRRAAVDGDATYLYPVRATRQKMREMLLAMVERAIRLEAQPEFYNSFTNNCASNLVAHVNQVAPGRIPSGIKVLLPGYADEVALSLGLIDAGADVEAARRRFLINERARAAMDSDSFSVLIRR